MNRSDIYSRLSQAKPDKVADLTAGIIDILLHRVEKGIEGLYRAGWNDSRDTVLELFRTELNALGIDVES